MSFQITIQPSGHTFTPEADETVLEAALRGGQQALAVGLAFERRALRPVSAMAQRSWQRALALPRGG